MPTVTATAYPDRDYVLVETDWTDQVSTTHVAAYRVRGDTGERTALYPYVAYNESGCQMLNCGQALWWDTDPPLGVPLTYVVEDCADGGLEFVTCSDTYARTPVAAGWGTTTSGCPWTTAAGGAAQFNTDGIKGNMAPNVTGASFQQVFGPSVITSQLRFDFVVPALALTQPFNVAAMLRWVDVNNYMVYNAQLNTAGTVTTVIQTNVGGVFTTIDSDVVPGLTYTSGTRLNLLASANGGSHQMKVWTYGAPEPVNFSSSVFNAVVPGPGQAGIRTQVVAGNTNVLPLTFAFDNVRLLEQSAASTVTSVTSNEVTLDAGRIWLKSPLFPCSDIELVTCGGAAFAGCEADEVVQVAFSSMAEESFAANTVNLLPVNRRRPIAISRIRRDIESTLVVVSRNFTSRDALRTINLPGTPLFFQAPAAYGIADRYMSVGTVTESRGLPDHKFQPRVVTMPHAVVDRPEGPAEGVCGARVDDLCDLYTSWDALTLAGFDYRDLLLGLAATGAPGQPTDFDTWQQVLDENGTWTVVNNGQDWQQVWED